MNYKELKRLIECQISCNICNVVRSHTKFVEECEHVICTDCAQPAGRKSSYISTKCISCNFALHNREKQLDIPYLSTLFSWHSKNTSISNRNDNLKPVPKRVRKIDKKAEIKANQYPKPETRSVNIPNSKDVSKLASRNKAKLLKLKPVATLKQKGIINHLTDKLKDAKTNTSILPTSHKNVMQWLLNENNAFGRSGQTQQEVLNHNTTLNCKFDMPSVSQVAMPPNRLRRHTSLGSSAKLKRTEDANSQHTTVNIKRHTIAGNGSLEYENYNIEEFDTPNFTSPIVRQVIQQIEEDFLDNIDNINETFDRNVSYVPATSWRRFHTIDAAAKKQSKNKTLNLENLKPKAMKGVSIDAGKQKVTVQPAVDERIALALHNQTINNFLVFNKVEKEKAIAQSHDAVVELNKITLAKTRVGGGTKEQIDVGLGDLSQHRDNNVNSENIYQLSNREKMSTMLQQMKELASVGLAENFKSLLISKIESLDLLLRSNEEFSTSHVKAASTQTNFDYKSITTQTDVLKTISKYSQAGASECETVEVQTETRALFDKFVQTEAKPILLIAETQTDRSKMIISNSTQTSTIEDNRPDADINGAVVCNVRKLGTSPDRVQFSSDVISETPSSKKGTICDDLFRGVEPDNTEQMLSAIAESVDVISETHKKYSLYPTIHAATESNGEAEANEPNNSDKMLNDIAESVDILTETYKSCMYPSMHVAASTSINNSVSKDVDVCVIDKGEPVDTEQMLNDVAESVDVISETYQKSFMFPPIDVAERVISDAVMNRVIDVGSVSHCNELINVSGNSLDNVEFDSPGTAANRTKINPVNNGRRDNLFITQAPPKIFERNQSPRKYKRIRLCDEDSDDEQSYNESLASAPKKIKNNFIRDDVSVMFDSEQPELKASFPDSEDFLAVDDDFELMDLLEKVDNGILKKPPCRDTVKVTNVVVIDQQDAIFGDDLDETILESGLDAAELASTSRSISVLLKEMAPGNVPASKTIENKTVLKHQPVIEYAESTVDSPIVLEFIPPPPEFANNCEEMLKTIESPKPVYSQRNVLESSTQNDRITQMSLTPATCSPITPRPGTSRRTVLSLVPKPKMKSLNITIASPRQGGKQHSIRQYLQRTQSTQSRSNLNLSTTSLNIDEGDLDNLQESRNHLSTIVCPRVAWSRLNKEQVLLIGQLSQKKLIAISTTFTDSVTHLIVATNAQGQVKDHTMKYISAVAAGCWVLNSKWIETCIARNAVISEEAFEVLDVSGNDGPRQARTLRTTSPLLLNYHIYAAPPFKDVDQDVLEKIITDLGGVVVQNVISLSERQRGDIGLVVAEASSSQSFVVDTNWLTGLKVATVDIEWLSRSVGQYRPLSLLPFLLCDEDAVMNLPYPEELLEQASYSFTPTCSD